MSNQLNNPLWYRVAPLRPSLASHARIQPQQFRGQTWYVLHNRVSGRFFRFSPAAYDLIRRMDGAQSVHEIWKIASDGGDENAPTQDETIDLLARLYAADALKSSVTPDLQEAFQRRVRQQHSKRTRQLKNPLAIRIPLFDPDRLLERLVPMARPLFGRTALAAWTILIAVAVVLAVVHWGEITGRLSDRLLSPQNLVLLWLLYPLVKALHELGHGLAAKVWGGEVHEMGIVLIALMPIPYVDASCATWFPEKRRRIVVSAAGIMVEVMLAALALFLWLNAEPGLVSALTYNVMLIGAVSTLFVNGNPLLRFDGYYVFADAIDIPNLATRATKYLAYLIQRYLFGLRDSVSPATARGERVWFITYGTASYLYRVVILVTIILFVAEEYLTVGVILGAWAATTLLLLPVLKQFQFVLSSPRLARRRLRAVSVTSALIFGVMGLLFALPFPLSTTAQGVVAASDQAEVRAGTDGVITRLISEPGRPVTKGDPLIETEDAFMTAHVQLLAAKLRGLQARHDNLMIARRHLDAAVVKEEIIVTQADLDAAHERTAALVIRSPATGLFVTHQPRDLPGRFVHQGDLVGYVMNVNQASVHVAIPQDDIGLVRRQTRSVQVRLAERLDVPVPAQVIRQVPAAGNQLPSAALGPLGGGPFAVHPNDSTGIQALEAIFEVQLELSTPVNRLGGRVYVRFDHGREPLAQQWYRRFRQLFLSRFNV